MAQPEITACSAARAGLQQQLLYCRNSLSGRLELLNCPRSACVSLDAMLENLGRDLPDPAGLAQSLADPELDFDGFQQRLGEIEQLGRELAQLPSAPAEYLQAVADQEEAGKLGLLYWACVHHPLRDRFFELAKAVQALLKCDWLDRMKQDHQIRQNAEAAEGAVEVYSYDSFDLYGSCFGWNLSVYWVGEQVAAEIHQWVSEEEPADPSITVIQSGMDLADLLRSGEADGIWQIGSREYLEAVERVFDFDEDLGLDLYDALINEYGLELPPFERPDLQAAWTAYRQWQAEDAPDEATAGVDSQKGVAPTDNSIREPATASHDEDPIADLVSRMTVEPVDIEELRKRRGVGPWASKIAAERSSERREAARQYLLDFVQRTLELPAGRHTVKLAGDTGRGIWVDFGGGGN